MRVLYLLQPLGPAGQTLSTISLPTGSHNYRKLFLGQFATYPVTGQHSSPSKLGGASAQPFPAPTPPGFGCAVNSSLMLTNPVRPTEQ